MQRGRSVLTLRSLISASAIMVCISPVSHASVQPIDLPKHTEAIQWQTLSVVDAGVIWLGSNAGHIARSDDLGNSWSVSHPTANNLLPITQIKAIDDRQAFALTQGRGSDSRLYHTRNGGYSWNRVYRAKDNEQLRCFDLIPDAEGWILADGLNDNWHVVRTTNGRRWLDSRSGFDTTLNNNEGAYSDSGSCVHYANNTWVMATAYANPARIAVKSTTALRFNVHDTPFNGANPAVTAVYPLSTGDVLLTGGDLDDVSAEPIIYRWQNQEYQALQAPQLQGILTNLAIHNDSLVVANQSGTAWSKDWGETWSYIEQPAQQLRCSDEQGCFALDTEQLTHFKP